MADTKHPSLKLLDDVLRHLKDTTDVEPVDLDSMLMVWIQGISPRNKRAVQDKLKREGMIDSVIPNGSLDVMPNLNFVKDREYQFITFDGLVLLETEDGYYGRKVSSERIKITDSFLKVFAILSSLVALVGLVLNFLTYRHVIERDSSALVSPSASPNPAYSCDSTATHPKLLKTDSMPHHKDSIKP